MKKLLIRYISTILVALLLITCMPINASANFSDVPENAKYADALDYLTSLGIIAGQEKFNPDGFITREQFAKIIVIAAGLESTAESMKGSTIFPDIAANTWSSGYINVAVNNGYITGWSDGKFHPTQAITYAQICTVLVRALGYTAMDLTGDWPFNYISKAKSLGLADGILLNTDASVPRWAVVMMVEKLLKTNVKGGAATGQTFIDATGYFIKCTVFGDSSIIDYLNAGQVLTDKGIYNNPSNIKLELGSENYIAVENGNIKKATTQSSILKISVDHTTENRVSFKIGDSEQGILLPNNITYYYEGQKIDYTKLSDILQKSASIVLTYNSNKTGFAFGVVFDPIYSKPEIAKSITPSSNKIGSIILDSNPLIMKDGNIISISQIESKDIVYQVSDIWGTNRYMLVYDNKVGGKITNVIPSRLSPKTLQIDNVNYDFSKDIDLSKINSYNIDLSSGNNIIVYLGYDGKIVNIEGFGTYDTSAYAVVLNSGYSISTDLNGSKKNIYTAKLLLSDGYTATYNVKSNASEMKGKLVKYTIASSDTVSLEQISYNFPGETYIKKDERLMGDSYVSDNVKIFNLTYNDTGTEASANLLKWSDLPGGIIPDGKIWYTNTSGPFNDIDLIYTDDIFNQRNKVGMIKSIGLVPTERGSSFLYTILIEGKVYNYTEYDSEISLGSVFKFKLTNTGISSLSHSIAEAVTATNIQAVDSRRIKLNDKIYYFNSNVSVYVRDSNDTIRSKTLADINTNQTYQKVALYTDNRNDASSKVNIVYLIE